MADFDKVIPPGQEGKINLEIAGKKVHGNFSKSATVYTNDPVHAQLTITVGVATWEPNSSETFDEVRLGADQALLAAKRKGRNRVGVHLPPPGTARKRSPSESSTRLPRQRHAEG